MKSGLRLLIHSELLIFFLLISISCSKDKVELTDNGTVQIVSLVASDTILTAWIDTASVEIVATGTGLSYHWACNHGTIRGSGSTIKYTAGECCVGLNTISCRVSNDSSSVSGEIMILITSYFDQ